MSVSNACDGNSLHKFMLMVGLLSCMTVPGAYATTIFNLQAGSEFFDATSGSTENLTGTVTTELLELSLDFRQNIVAFDILGPSVHFNQAFFGGGAVDIRKATGQIVQVQVIVGKTNIGQCFANGQCTRFIGGTNNTFTGALDSPTTLSLNNLQPSIGAPTLGFSQGDRLTLKLASSVAGVPEPATLTLLALGLVGAGFIGRKAA